MIRPTTKNIEYKYNSVYELLWTKFVDTPDSEFVISLYGGSEERFTFRQFISRAELIRQFFIENGYGKGDVVNLILQNSADFLFIYFAALSLGIVVSPINYSLASREIGYIINDSKSLLIIVDGEYLNKVEEISDTFICPKRMMILQKSDVEAAIDKHYQNFYDIYNSSEIVEPTKPDNAIGLLDKSVIIYTSGTSGNPKGVVLTNSNLLSDAMAIAEWFHFDQTSRTLCILPLFHNNGQVVTLLAPLWAGGSTVMIKGNVSIASFWDLVNKFSVSWSSVIPTILSVMINFKVRRKDSTMKGIICGGALLPIRVQEEFEERFSVPIYEGFGLTETTSFSCFNPYEKDKRIKAR